jgi:hypothetical protein
LAHHLAERGLVAHLSISDEADYAVAFVILESSSSVARTAVRKDVDDPSAGISASSKAEKETAKKRKEIASAAASIAAEDAAKAVAVATAADASNLTRALPSPLVQLKNEGVKKAMEEAQEKATRAGEDLAQVVERETKAQFLKESECALVPERQW